MDALQKVGMRHRPRRQAWACNVMLNTCGSDLTLLKSLLDDGPDYHTTFKLVSVDLQVSQSAASGQLGSAWCLCAMSSPGNKQKIVMVGSQMVSQARHMLPNFNLASSLVPQQQWSTTSSVPWPSVDSKGLGILSLPRTTRCTP